MMTSLWFVVFLAIRHFSNFVDNDNDNYIDNLVVLLARGDFREEVIKMMTMVMTSLLFVVLLAIGDFRRGDFREDVMIIVMTTLVPKTKFCGVWCSPQIVLKFLEL